MPILCWIHSIEEVLNVPHRLADQPMKLQSVDTDGSAHTVYMRSHYNAQQPHAPQLAGGYRSWFRAVHVGIGIPSIEFMFYRKSSKV